MNADTSPAVTIIMPAYNASAYIAEAIQSVLDQTWTNWELIIVDDGSTDNSLQTIKSKVERGYNGIINYTSTIDTFTGGAHGSFATTMLNFDPATGEVIELSDFFKENYEEVLIDRLIRALIKKSGAKSFEELQEMGYLVLNDMFVTNNFVLGKEEILFHFNHYDIAPYALGTCDLSFTYDELKDIIKD